MLIFLWSFLIIIGFNQNVCQAEDRPHIIFFLADDLGKLVTTHIIHAPFFIEYLAPLIEKFETFENQEY